MGACQQLGVCGLSLSVWGVIQMSIMGYLYSIEASTLIHDVEPHHGEYTSYDDFIEKCKENYKNTSLNCYIVAVCYLGVLAVSVMCLFRARQIELRTIIQRNDDEYFCAKRPTTKTFFKKFDKKRV